MDAKTENNHLEQFSKAVNFFRDRAIQVLVIFLFHVTRRLVLTFQSFTWAVTGVERIRRDAARGLQFKQSAHVQDIFWKRKFLNHSIADPSNFITVHNCFKQPSCVLKANVSLYCMTRTEAVFVEVNETDNVYRPKITPYLYHNQFELATKVITIPLASFHKIASDVGNPRVPVTWLGCTQRSGANLICQMMQRIPGMLVLSEPDAITSLGYLHTNKLLQQKEYNQLLSGCVRLLCKPDDRYNAIFIKMRPSTTSLLEDIADAFPRFRYLFMYRNSVRSVMSNLIQLSHDPAQNVLRFIMDSKPLSLLLPFIRSKYYYSNVHLNEKKVTGIVGKKLDTVGILTTAWAASVSRCADIRYRGYPIECILYEDFMKNPRRSLSMLLRLLDVRMEHLNVAAEALKEDINTSQIYESGYDSRRSLAPESRQEADNILKAYGLPKLGERHEMKGMLKLE